MITAETVITTVVTRAEIVTTTEVGIKTVVTTAIVVTDSMTTTAVVTTAEVETATMATDPTHKATTPNSSPNSHLKLSSLTCFNRSSSQSNSRSNWFCVQTTMHDVGLLLIFSM